MSESDFLKLVKTFNNETSKIIRENIENFYEYSYDGGSNSIVDGGNDMYDNGNSVRII